MAQDDQDDLSPEERKTPGRFTGPGLVVPLLILAIIAGYLYLLGSGPRKISYKLFLEQLRAKNVAEVDLFTRYAIGKFKQPVAVEASSDKASSEKPAAESKREGEAQAAREAETAAEPSPEKKKSATTTSGTAKSDKVKTE